MLNIPKEKERGFQKETPILVRIERKILTKITSNKQTKVNRRGRGIKKERGTRQWDAKEMKYRGGKSNGHEGTEEKKELQISKEKKK